LVKISPQAAWENHLQQPSMKARWLEDSKDISKALPLSKRELFGLIILAYLQNHTNNSKDWFVGYDSGASEPNDGFVSDGKSRIDVEHKIIPQMSTQNPLEAILSTYEKYAKKGIAYGGGRTIIIFPNLATKGLIKISSLRDKINGSSPFDRVLLMSTVAMSNNNTTANIHITEHYPGEGIAQVDFNLLTGGASVPYYGITSE